MQTETAEPQTTEHPLMIEIQKTVSDMSVRVTNPAQLQGAEDFRRRLKELKKKVCTYWDADISNAHTLWKSLTSKKKVQVDRIDEADGLIEAEISKFLVSERRRVEAEEEKARVAAREKEERERQRLLQAAEEAKAAGKEFKAESLQQKAEDVYVAPKAVAPAVSTKGQRTTYDPVFEDQAQIPSHFLVIDWEKTTTKLRKYAEENQGRAKVPGVRFVERIIPVNK